MKAKTLRTFAHVTMDSIADYGTPRATGWKTIWVLWGPYVGAWKYHLNAGTPRLRSKAEIGNAWRAGESYVNRFPIKSYGETTWKYCVSSHHKGDQVNCSILTEWMYRMEDSVGKHVKYPEKYLRTALQNRMSEALKTVPSWALKLYNSKEYRGLGWRRPTWDLIARNPNQEFWAWVLNHDQGKRICSLLQGRKMRNCTVANFKRKLYGAGFRGEEVNSYLAGENVEVEYFRQKRCNLPYSDWLYFRSNWHTYAGYEPYSNPRCKKELVKLMRSEGVSPKTHTATMLVAATTTAKLELPTSESQWVLRWLPAFHYPSLAETSVVAQVAELATVLGHKVSDGMFVNVDLTAGKDMLERMFELLGHKPVEADEVFYMLVADEVRKAFYRDQAITRPWQKEDDKRRRQYSELKGWYLPGEQKPVDVFELFEEDLHAMSRYERWMEARQALSA